MVGEGGTERKRRGVDGVEKEWEGGEGRSPLL